MKSCAKGTEAVSSEHNVGTPCFFSIFTIRKNSMKDLVKKEYSRVEVTNLLLSHHYKPTIMKVVSEYFDVYVKGDLPRVQLPKERRVFPRTELEIILPKELREAF